MQADAIDYHDVEAMYLLHVQRSVYVHQVMTTTNSTCQVAYACQQIPRWSLSRVGTWTMPMGRDDGDAGTNLLVWVILLVVIAILAGLAISRLLP